MAVPTALLALLITPMHSTQATHSWAFVEAPEQGASWWQPLAPDSVFEIPDPKQREDEIRRRQLDLGKPGITLGCPSGMVRATGQLRDRNETTARQNAACKDPHWDPKYLCTRFDPEKLRKPPAAPTRAMDFCVDRYEFPNVPGEYPGVLFSWKDSDRLCRAQGKHLCTEDEWVFACEGPDALPYPNGYNRYLSPDSRFPEHVLTGDGCNVDVIRTGIHFDRTKLVNRGSAGLMLEIDPLWEGTRSGERSACVSPFGAYDLTGNVEEWTTRLESPRPSILRGGYWFPVESRCQPANAFHGPGHSFYQTGFRCCSEPSSL